MTDKPEPLPTRDPGASQHQPAATTKPTEIPASWEPHWSGTAATTHQQTGDKK